MFALQSNQGFYHGVQAKGKPEWRESISPTSRFTYNYYGAAYAAVQELERDGMDFHSQLSIVRIA